jgi:hypothetical protein
MLRWFGGRWAGVRKLLLEGDEKMTLIDWRWEIDARREAGKAAECSSLQKR